MRAILNSNVYNSNGTCRELQTVAFDSHPSCYTDNGFCTDILLSVTNLYCLAVEVYRWNDFFNKQAIQQVHQINMYLKILHILLLPYRFMTQQLHVPSRQLIVFCLLWMVGYQMLYNLHVNSFKH